jgi:hypothetical protein
MYCSMIGLVLESKVIQILDVEQMLPIKFGILKLQ